MRAGWRDGLLLVALCALGCMHMLADVLGMPRIKALAQATQMSPAMKVFTAQSGYETYAAEFYVGNWDVQGHYREALLDRSRYQRLHGPYNRRNVYGAAFSYGPLLANNPRTAAMYGSVLRYALCAPGGVVGELELPIATRYRVRVQPLRPAPAGLELDHDIDCTHAAKEPR